MIGASPCSSTLSRSPAVEQHAQRSDARDRPSRRHVISRPSGRSHSTSARSGRPALEERAAPQNRLRRPQRQRPLARTRGNAASRRRRDPRRPRQRRVLAVRVVVATLRSAQLVAAARSSARPATPSASAGSCGAGARRSSSDRRHRSSALDAAVPAQVVRVAVAVVFAVGLVVFLVVRDEIGQREPVVRGHEVDAGVRLAARRSRRDRCCRPAAWPAPAACRGRRARNAARRRGSGRSIPTSPAGKLPT